MADSLGTSFLTRVRAGLASRRDLSQLASWVEANTRHPKDSSRAWSFEEHEFQVAILSSPANDLVVRKIAQIGLSEVSVRMALGLVDIYPHSTAIYTLPTASDAAIFAKARFDSVIDNSPELSSKVDRNTDSASVKKIGDSFLYIRGTFTQRAAISIPADILIHDELDFSDQGTLTTYTSRLGHVKEDQIIKRRFSTPTVSGYGVSLLFDDSTQSWRAVKCDRCGTWQVPKFLEDVVIPGFTKELLKFEREDLTDPRYDIANAYLACPHCREELTVANLADPSKREWVSAFPSASRVGFQVQSFDVPTINPIPRTLRQVENYARKGDFINFAVGQPYDDNETSFNKQAVQAAHCLEWVQPRPGAANGTVIGVDVGKTCHVVIGVPKPVGMDVIHYERVAQGEQRTLSDRVRELAQWYGAHMVVIDAGPEWSQALAVVEKLPAGRAYACYYGEPTKPVLSILLSVDEEVRVVRADRTALISSVAKRVNEGDLRFCRCPEQPVMAAHLDVMKKVRKFTAKGDERDAWENSAGKPDHFAHALFFATVAAHVLAYTPAMAVVPCLPLPTKVHYGLPAEPPRSYLDRR